MLSLPPDLTAPLCLLYQAGSRGGQVCRSLQCNQLGVKYLVGTWVQHKRDMEASNGGPRGRRHSVTQGGQWRNTWRGGALTTAGEAIPVQLVALVAATQEGPIGVETALLAWSPHVTFVHI